MYGYQLSCILVVDEYMNGVPGAFMISSSEAANEQVMFIKAVEDAINADIQSASTIITALAITLILHVWCPTHD
jgi:hypothetical protein